MNCQNKNSRIVALHRTLQSYFKKKLLSIDAEDYKRLEKYRNNFVKSLSKNIQITDEIEVRSCVKNSKIILCGDFHTFEGSQKNFLRICSMLKSLFTTQKVVIALEAFDKKDQEYINNYLEDKISENDFLEQTDYVKKWGFPWQGYREIFAYAKKNMCYVVGVDNRGDKLENRDKVIAKRVVGLTKIYPDSVVFCLVGQHHLSKYHLPKEIDCLVKNKDTNVGNMRILSNVEEYFYRLLESGYALDFVNYLKINKTQFCIVNTAPWLKWFNHFLWEKHNDLFDLRVKNKPYYRQNIPNSSFEIDYHILSMSQVVSVFWKKNIDSKYFDYLDIAIENNSTEEKNDSYFEAQGYFFDLKNNTIYLKTKSIQNIIGAVSEFYIKSTIVNDLPESNTQIVVTKALSVMNTIILNPFADKSWFIDNCVINEHIDLCKVFNKEMTMISNHVFLDSRFYPAKHLLYIGVELGIFLGRKFFEKGIKPQQLMDEIIPKVKSKAKAQKIYDKMLSFCR